MNTNNNAKKGRKPYRGRRNNTKGEDKRQYDYRRQKRDETDDSPRSAPANDVSWYTRYPSLLEGTAQVSFPNRPGMSYNPVTRDPNVMSFPEILPKLPDYNVPIPGVLAIDWYPSIGLSTGSQNDAASQVSRELYARVRAAYSSDLEADGPDMFVYINALDSIFSYIAWLKRICRALNSWSPDNYVLPEKVLLGCNLTPGLISDLRAHKTEFRGHINDLIYQTQTFRIPAVFDVMNRHYWLNDNVFLDTNDITGQIYMFNQLGWYQFKELPVTGGVASGCTMINAPANEATTELELYEFGQMLLNDLYEWSTARTINGYFQRVFGDSGLFTVELLPEGEKLQPIYSEEILMQIENVRCVQPGTLSVEPNLEGMTISQNPKTNAVLCNNELRINFTMMRSYNHSWISPSLNIRSQVPSVAEVVVASRMNAAFYITSMSDPTDFIITVDSGTEIPWRMRMLMNTYPLFNDSGLVVPPFIDVTSANANTAELGLSYLESWDWHPFVFQLITRGTGESAKHMLIPQGDIHNLAYVDYETMRNIHRVCLLSEYNAYSIM